MTRVDELEEEVRRLRGLLYKPLYASELPPSLQHVIRPRQHVIVFGMLWRALGLYVAKGRIIEALWSDEGREEPDNADNSVEAVVSKLRRQIRSSGFTIEAGRHIGYRLVGRSNEQSF